MRSHSNRGRSRVWKRKQLIKKCWRRMASDFQGRDCMNNRIRVSWVLCCLEDRGSSAGDSSWKLWEEMAFGRVSWLRQTILLYSFNWWQKVPTTTVKEETVREGIVVDMSTTKREAWAPSRCSGDNLSSPPDAVGWWYTSAWWLWAEIHNFTSLRAASLSIVESG